MRPHLVHRDVVCHKCFYLSLVSLKGGCTTVRKARAPKNATKHCKKFRRRVLQSDCIHKLLQSCSSWFTLVVEMAQEPRHPLVFIGKSLCERQRSSLLSLQQLRPACVAHCSDQETSLEPPLPGLANVCKQNITHTSATYPKNFENKCEKHVGHMRIVCF